MAYELLDAAPAGRYEVLEPAAVTTDQPIKKAFNLKGEGFDKINNYSAKDAIGGLVRGAGSIGATLLAPYDYAMDAYKGDRGPTLSGLVAGQQPVSRNAERRTAMDGGLQALGADPESMAYKTNKLIGEVAGTSGIGGAAANLLGRIPGVAAAAPRFLQALSSSGMSTGSTAAPGLAPQAADMGIRMAGGSINGALTSGAVDPKDAQTGAGIGAAFPLAVKLTGAIGNAAGDLFRSKPLNPVLQKTLEDSIGAGYVVPPNMVNPNLKNQVIESISGKQATQQIASTKNTEVTEGLVRKALGIADDVPLSQGTLESLRKTAGRAYGEVSALSPQAAADLEALKVARNEAQGWFKAYNRSARPDDLLQAKQARALSDSLETALETHAAQANQPELIPALRDARKQIAKTYTVGRALNDASGTVDARVFGRMSEKGLPLSDGLDVAGKFASAFPTIAKSPQQVGSPAAHNLKAGMAALMGGGGAATLGPFGFAAAALPFLAPPVARSLMFRQGAQQGLLNQGGGMGGLLGNSIDEALPLMYRTNPLLANYGQ